MFGTNNLRQKHFLNLLKKELALSYLLRHVVLPEEVMLAELLSELESEGNPPHATGLDLSDQRGLSNLFFKLVKSSLV